MTERHDRWRLELGESRRAWTGAAFFLGSGAVSASGEARAHSIGRYLGPPPALLVPEALGHPWQPFGHTNKRSLLTLAQGQIQCAWQPVRTRNRQLRRRFPSSFSRVSGCQFRSAVDGSLAYGGLFAEVPRSLRRALGRLQTDGATPWMKLFPALMV